MPGDPLFAPLKDIPIYRVALFSVSARHQQLMLKATDSMFLLMPQLSPVTIYTVSYQRHMAVKCEQLA